jgi:hypothetical protein
VSYNVDAEGRGRQPTHPRIRICTLSTPVLWDVATYERPTRCVTTCGTREMLKRYVEKVHLLSWKFERRGIDASEGW